MTWYSLFFLFQLAILQADREREEREKKVLAMKEAERLAEEAKARELAAAASETGAGNETIDGSVSDVKVERSKSNSSTKGKWFSVLVELLLCDEYVKVTCAVF